MVAKTVVDDVEQCIGKVIAHVQFADDAYMAIHFTDGSVTVAHSKATYDGESEIEFPYEIGEVTQYNVNLQADLGLISREERTLWIAAHSARMREAERKQREAKDHAEYMRLKQKYEGHEAGCDVCGSFKWPDVIDEYSVRMVRDAIHVHPELMRTRKCAKWAAKHAKDIL